MKIKHYILLVLCSLSFGCISEEDVFDNEINLSLKTSFVPSLFQHYLAMQSQSDTCFNFIYPVTAFTNTGEEVTFINKDGLDNFIENQSNKYHLDGTVFPINISFRSNNTRAINNVNDFASLFSICQIKSIGQQMFDKIGCLPLKYPFEIISELNNENKAIITNQEEFVAIKNNPFFEHVKFKYPLEIDGGLPITNDYQHIQVLINCDKPTTDNVCPNYEIDVIDFGSISSVVNFIIKPENDILPISTEWSVEGEIVNDVTDSRLQYDFNELLSDRTRDKIFEICAKSTFENCLTTKEVCVTINRDFEVPEECRKSIDFSIEKDINTEGRFKFNAIFDAIDPDNTFYAWIVDSESINQISNEAFYQFPEPGKYSVCVTAREATIDCDVDVSVFPNHCLDLFLDENFNFSSCSRSTSLDVTQNDEFPDVYKFIATYDSPNPSLVNYNWDVKLEDEVIESSKIEGFNEFSFKFPEAKRYDVCVLVENNNCIPPTRTYNCFPIFVNPEDLTP